MKFSERKQFLYDPQLFTRFDTKTALKLHDEYVKKHSPVPPPKFLEVSRDPNDIDPLWHAPISTRTQFSRELCIPAINQFQKPDWRLTKIGVVPQRRDNFWLSNISLSEFDYFPLRGDLVYWYGYRYMIENVDLPPEAYWQQTGVWLGLVCKCIIVPEGDVRPLKDAGHTVPAEVRAAPRALPEP